MSSVQTMKSLLGQARKRIRYLNGRLLSAKAASSTKEAAPSPSEVIINALLKKRAKCEGCVPGEYCCARCQSEEVEIYPLVRRLLSSTPPDPSSAAREAVRAREMSIVLGMIETEADILTTASKGSYQLPITSVEKIGRNIKAALARLAALDQEKP